MQLCCVTPPPNGFLRLRRAEPTCRANPVFLLELPLGQVQIPQVGSLSLPVAVSHHYQFINPPCHRISRLIISQIKLISMSE